MALVLLLATLTTGFYLINGQSACSPPSAAAMLELVKQVDELQQQLANLKKSLCAGDIPKTSCSSTDSSSCDSGSSTPNAPCVQVSSCSTSQDSECCRPNPVAALDFCATSVSADPPIQNYGCCGVDSIGNQISRGARTRVAQYPWLAILDYRDSDVNEIICAGSLISARYVLTGAQCVVANQYAAGPPNIVRLGEYDTKNEGPDCTTTASGRECTDGVIRIGIERNIPHPDYTRSKQPRPHDIALIKLKQVAPFTDFIRPICLPSTDVTTATPVNFTMYAAGFGEPLFGDSASNVKLQVDLPFVTNDQCETIYKTRRRSFGLPPGALCAGGVPGKDACNGDGGGPLMYHNGRSYEIVGVVSSGPSDCGIESNVPGVYTKVYDYVDWIRNTIKTY